MSNKTKIEEKKKDIGDILMNNRQCILEYHETNEYALSRKMTQDFCVDDRTSALNDVMFKTMFLNTSRINLTRYLLYSALDLNLTYDFICKHVDFYKNIVDSEHVNNKKEMQDLVMKLDDGNLIGIELNNYNYLERNLDYASRVAASRVTEGTKYKFNAVLLINLNNFSYTEVDKTKETFYIQNDEGLLYAKRSFVEIYLPKIYQKWYNGGKESLSEKEKILLCMFTSSKSLAQELAEGDEILMEYNRELEKAGSDIEIITSYDRLEAERLGGIEQTRINTAKEMAEQGFTLDQISNVTKFSFEELEKIGVEPKPEKITAYDRREADRFEGREEGFEEGLEKGIQQGTEQNRIEIAKRMLQKGMPLDEVHSFIPEISFEDLEKIKKDML